MGFVLIDVGCWLLTGASERYRFASSTSWAREEEAQAQEACAVSQLFLHGINTNIFLDYLFV